MECPQRNGHGTGLIVAYTARTLDPETEAALERHLESCAGCRDVAAAQQAVWSALDELTSVTISSNFDARLYQRIATEQQRSWWPRCL